MDDNFTESEGGVSFLWRVSVKETAEGKKKKTRRRKKKTKQEVRKGNVVFHSISFFCF